MRIIFQTQNKNKKKESLVIKDKHCVHPGSCSGSKSFNVCVVSSSTSRASGRPWSCRCLKSIYVPSPLPPAVLILTASSSSCWRSCCEPLIQTWLCSCSSSICSQNPQSEDVTPRLLRFLLSSFGLCRGDQTSSELSGETLRAETAEQTAADLWTL